MQRLKRYCRFCSLLWSPPDIGQPLEDDLRQTDVIVLPLDMEIESARSPEETGIGIGMSRIGKQREVAGGGRRWHELAEGGTSWHELASLDSEPTRSHRWMRWKLRTSLQLPRPSASSTCGTRRTRPQPVSCCGQRMCTARCRRRVLGQLQASSAPGALRSG